MSRTSSKLVSPRSSGGNANYSFITSLAHDPTDREQILPPPPPLDIPPRPLYDEAHLAPLLLRLVVREYLAPLRPLLVAHARERRAWRRRVGSTRTSRSGSSAGDMGNSLTGDRLRRASSDGSRIGAEQQAIDRVRKVVPATFMESPANFCVWKTEPAIAAVQRHTHSQIVIQEQLGNYLDAVEVALLTLIRNRSDDFFDALCKMHDLYVEMGLIRHSMQKMRKRMRYLQRQLVRPRAYLLACKRRQHNVCGVLRIMESINTVLTYQETIKTLLASSQFSYALDLIESTKKVVEMELYNVHCVQSLPKKLDLMKAKIADLIKAEFTRIALHGLMEGTESSDSTIADDIVHLHCLVLDMNRVGSFDGVIFAYRTGLLQSVKEQSASVMQSCLSATGKFKGSSTDGRKVTIQDITFDEFMPLLIRSLKSALKVLRRAESVHRRLIAVLEVPIHSNSPPNPAIDDPEREVPSLDHLSSSETAALQQKFDDALAAASEEAHSRCARMLSMRSDANKLLQLHQFRQIVELCLRFVDDTELRCRRTFYSLRGTLLSQGRTFVDSFFKANAEELTRLLESESWARIDSIPRRFQRLLDRKFETIRSPPNEDGSGNAIDNLLGPSPASQTPATITAEPWKLPRWDEGPDLASHNEASAKCESASIEHLVSNDQRFYVVACTLGFLKILSSCVQIAEGLPALATESLSKLVDLLKFFNSRVCQLVLGAGAMHVAGLKSITATHLALSSQAVGLIESQIPSLREAFAARIPPKRSAFLVELDRVSKDYRLHQVEISTKLVSIMAQLVESVGHKILNAPWVKRTRLATFASSNKDEEVAHDEDPPDGPAVDEFIRTLMKQLSTLHRVLSSILPSRQRDEIFEDIATQLGKKLRELFIRIETKLVDAEPHQTNAPYRSSALPTVTPSSREQRELVNRYRRQASARIVANITYILSKMQSLEISAENTRRELDQFLVSSDSSEQTLI